MNDWAAVVAAALLIVFGALSARLARVPVTQAIFFTTSGALVGVTGLVDVELDNSAVRLLAETTLALLLFTDAVRIDMRALLREYDVPLRLLGIGLPLTIVAGTVAALALFGEAGLWPAVVLAVVLAPTDAALGLPVVTDPRLPLRVRQGLNVESGLNDGICVPLLLIALALAGAVPGEVEPVRVVAEEIGLGVLAGALAGGAGGWVLYAGHRRGWVEGTWGQIATLAVPLLAAALTRAVGGSSFIAAFGAGIVFGAVTRLHETRDVVFAERSGEALNALTFLLFGGLLAAPALTELTWAVALYALLSLTVVRAGPVALAMIGSGTRPPTTVFLGWFGPRGLASIVFAILLAEDTQLPGVDLITTVATWTVLASVCLHGVTAPAGAARYGSWYAAHPRREEMAESLPAHEHRVRFRGRDEPEHDAVRS